MNCDITDVMPFTMIFILSTHQAIFHRHINNDRTDIVCHEILSLCCL